LIIKEFDIKIHDSNKLAELIFTVDSETFIRVFKSEKLAISAIKDRLIVQNDIINQHSQKLEKTYVLLENNDIKGLLLIVKGKNRGFLNEIIFLLKNLKVSTALKFLYIEFLDYFVLSKSNEDDVYLAELAIDKKEQGKGYGKMLLNKTIEIAKKEGFRRVILDVELSNTKALKIYEHVGFKKFNKRTDKIFNRKRGMFNMEYIL
jgi:ribosomal protein S18 acetylase RimI-like enzyme